MPKTTYIGIVGHAADKFTPETEKTARYHIRNALISTDNEETMVLISGGCHLGGIDIFAEEEADSMEIGMKIFLPKTLNWQGYKARNILIAENSTEVYSFVVPTYPKGYMLERYGSRNGKPYCYHCNEDTHVKSGGCWTAKYAREKLNKPGHTIILPPTL